MKLYRATITVGTSVHDERTFVVRLSAQDFGTAGKRAEVRALAMHGRVVKVELAP